MRVCDWLTDGVAILVLIQDCHQQVLFLNRVPLAVLEESIQVFRENIFSMTDRRQIPYLIY